jgi:fluoroquinolone transport system ATP-binding protein
MCAVTTDGCTALTQKGTEQVMQRLKPVASASNLVTDVIRVRGLTFAYPKAAEPALRGMDFTVGRGEIFGFLGPSGAGKSTTQKVLIGLLRGHGGDAAVWGRDPLAWGPDYYQRIGVSFELPNHYQKLSGLENLRFFASLYDVATLDPMQLLDAVGLAEDANVRVGKYSKGMQMRLTFARALLNDPELLFLDEPTSGLDPVNARKVKNMILGLKARGRTIFLTTHDMSTADELCDRVAFVVDGRIVALDRPAELKIARSQRFVRVEYRGNNGALASAEFPLDGLGDDPAFHAVLRGHHVETIHSREASLDDVFVEITGRRLS